MKKRNIFQDDFLQENLKSVFPDFKKSLSSGILEEAAEDATIEEHYHMFKEATERPEEEYGVNIWFTARFINYEMAQSFDEIAEHFLAGEPLLKTARETGLFHDFDYPYRMEKGQKDAYNFRILGMILKCAKSGSRFSRELILSLYKTYYRKEYNILKRMKELSIREFSVFAPRIFDDFEEDEETADRDNSIVARLTVIADLLGIELHFTWFRMIEILNENVLHQRTLWKTIEACTQERWVQEKREEEECENEEWLKNTFPGIQWISFWDDNEEENSGFGIVSDVKNIIENAFDETNFSSDAFFVDLEDDFWGESAKILKGYGWEPQSIWEKDSPEPDRDEQEAGQGEADFVLKKAVSDKNRPASNENRPASNENQPERGKKEPSPEQKREILERILLMATIRMQALSYGRLAKMRADELSDIFGIIDSRLIRREDFSDDYSEELVNQIMESEIRKRKPLEESAKKVLKTLDSFKKNQKDNQTADRQNKRPEEQKEKTVDTGLTGKIGKTGKTGKTDQTGQNVQKDVLQGGETIPYEEQIRLLKEQLARTEEKLKQQRSLYEESKAREELLKKRVDSAQKEHSELIALRNFTYRVEKEEDRDTYKPENGFSDKEDLLQQMIQNLKTRKITIIGGHVNWIKKIRQIFPEWSFVGASDGVSQSGAIASAEKVFFYTDILGHSTYEKYLKATQEQGKPFSFLHGTNVEKIVEGVYAGMEKN